MKKEKNLQKNLIAVGDFVLFDKIGPEVGVIHTIEPRKTILSRADNLSRKKEQILAANIDQVLITTSVTKPALKPSLVDRYIIATEMGGMKPIVVVNKIDLLTEREDKELLAEFCKIYREANVLVLPVSSYSGEGLESLLDIMAGKASVFSGQSGVGKSSLINAVTGSKLLVGSVVEATEKGSHTTTRAQLLPLECGGYVIDTPGVKSFGVWELEENKIRHYFDEIQKFSHECRYPDCSHIHEPGCAVQKALSEGKISPLRFSSYMALMEETKGKHKKR